MEVSKKILYILLDEDELYKLNVDHVDVDFLPRKDGKFLCPLAVSYYSARVVESVNEATTITESEVLKKERVVRDSLASHSLNFTPIYYGEVKQTITVDPIDTYVDEMLIKRKSHALRKLNIDDIKALGIEDIALMDVLMEGRNDEDSDDQF